MNDQIIQRFVGPYRFLSNFYPAVIIMDMELYPSVEHAYQAAKTLSPAERQEIRNCESPGRAKRMGRGVTIRDDWDEIKLTIMESLLRYKFILGASGRDLGERLCSTYPKKLEEGNLWGDTYWGVSLDTGKGENRLGRLLMKIRRDLMKGTPR